MALMMFSSAASARAAPRISGVSRYIKKEMGKKILSVGVEPANSAVVAQRLAGDAPAPRPPQDPGHRHPDSIPDTLDLAMVDRLETVTNEESIEMAPPPREKQEGILAGISCGMPPPPPSPCAWRSFPEFAGKTIVTRIT